MATGEERNLKGKKRYEVDPRVLGQILAAQNIDFVLPDTTHIADFFAEALINIPGVTSCRVCLQGMSAQKGEMENKICERCSSSHATSTELDEIAAFLPGFDFQCELGEQKGMQSALVASLNHPFGFFVFRVNDPDIFEAYKPFIKNLANYVALSLENRLQRKLLQRSQLELEHKVEERTRDLVAANVRLQEEIEIRRLAEEALRQREAQLRLQGSALEAAANSILITDDMGKIIWANSAFTRLTEYSIEEIVGQTPNILKSGKQSQDFYANLWNRILSGEIWHGELINRCKDGHLYTEEMTISPVYGEQGEISHFIAIKQDVSERKQHEREREVIVAVSSAMRQAATRIEMFSVILDQLLDLFDADGSMIALPSPSNEGIIVEMGRGVVGERFSGLIIPQGMGISDWVIKNKKSYLNNSADSDALFYRPDLLGDSRRVASVPLIAREQSIGALWIARRADILEQDLRLLSAIADIAANALYRIMLHEQTEQQLGRLIALHKIDVAITSNADINATLGVLLDNVKNELKVDAVSILLLNSVTHMLDYAAGIGFRTKGVEQSHVRLGEGCAGSAAQECRTVSCLDIEKADEGFLRPLFLSEEGFVLHCATPLVVKGQVKGVLELFHRKTFEPELAWLDYFETLATQAAIAIENASLFENLQRSNTELTLAYDATIEGWSRALDLRDRETEGHTQRVTQMALQLAEKMGMSEVEKMDLRRGALLHDIGKMGVPDAILLKPESLIGREWEIMRQHPIYAYQMLSPIKYLRHALEVPYYHHERWDGSGYPFGLMGEHIPLAARVFAVVDVFDALTSDRPYRQAWSHEDAYRYIEEQAGRYFDPQVVRIFLENRP